MKNETYQGNNLWFGKSISNFEEYIPQEYLLYLFLHWFWNDELLRQSLIICCLLASKYFFIFCQIFCGCVFNIYYCQIKDCLPQNQNLGFLDLKIFFKSLRNGEKQISWKSLKEFESRLKILSIYWDLCGSKYFFQIYSFKK